MLSTRHVLLLIFFCANMAFLCASSIFYSMGCIHYEAKCSQGANFIAVIFGVCAVFYGITCVGAMFYCYHQHSQSRGTVYYINYMMTLTAVSFVFSIVTGVGMLISLFFSWDPSDLDNTYKKVHWVLMWVLVGWAVLSNGLCLALVLLFSHQHTHRRHHRKFTTPEIYVSSPEGQVTEVQKPPLV